MGAAAASWLLGLGFRIPGVIGMAHLARSGEIWTLWGFPTYDDGSVRARRRQHDGATDGRVRRLCGGELVTGTMLWTVLILLA
jgi:hypothetical protein